MNPSEAVAAVLTTAAARVQDWLPRFRPWPSQDAGLSERNLAAQFAIAFLQQFPHGMVFLDLLLGKSGGRRAEHHLDAYLTTRTHAFMLECRHGLYQQYAVEDFLIDMHLLTPDLARQLQERHRGPTAPPSTVGVVLADAWGAKSSPPLWPHETLPIDWHYGSVRVWEDNDPAANRNRPVLYWLYAVSPALISHAGAPEAEEPAVQPAEEFSLPPTRPAVPQELIAQGWVYESGPPADMLEAAGAIFRRGNPAQGRYLLVFSPATQSLLGAFSIDERVPRELVERGWVYQDSLVYKLLSNARAAYSEGNPTPQEIYVFDRAKGHTIVGHYHLPAEPG